MVVALAHWPIQPIRIKQAKVPEGRYDMNLGELRTYTKDCGDYKKLKKYEDAEIILQLRWNMDQPLKRAVDVNHGSSWGNMSLDNALIAISNNNNKQQQTCNEVVYQREFHSKVQSESETIAEFLVRLRDCAVCGFVCPFNDSHDLTD